MPKSAIRLLGLLMGISAAAPAVAAPAMWEVRDADSAIWLFGSFHVLPEGLEWRTPLFDQTLADANKILFEADVRPGAMAELAVEAFARGIYTDGKLLSDFIDPAAEAKLREAASGLQLPVGSLLAMKPWFAANTISVSAMAAEGYKAEGVEFVLQPDLPADRQAYLETGEQQLDILSGAPETEQLAMLGATLEELDAFPKMLGKMVSNWVEGTPDKLARLFLSEMGGFEDAFLERLIYQRNRNWIAPLESMLEQDEEALVIVGAAHLIGDGSVLDLLEQAGYRIERIQ